MKLLLTSAGLTNDSIAQALTDLVGKAPQASSIAFVPTAANTEPGDKSWLIDDLARLKARGYAVDIVDISAIAKKIWQSRIEAADILFFGGGNTYHLLHWMRKSGLAAMLPELLKTRVYVGLSAGSIVTGPSLKTTSQYYPEDVGDGDAGLAMVDFYVLPHLNSPHFKKVREDSVQREFVGFSSPVYVLDDDSTIKVSEGEVEVITEGKYLVLRPE